MKKIKFLSVVMTMIMAMGAPLSYSAIVMADTLPASESEETEEEEPVFMPTVVRMNYQEAKEIIEDRIAQSGFDIEVELVWVDNFSSSKNLTVADTSPRGVYAITEDIKKVTIMVYKEYDDSIPKTDFVMPDLSGMTYREAKAAIEKLLKDNNRQNIPINWFWVPNTDEEKNSKIFKQTPEAGTTITDGLGSIDFYGYEGYVSTGDENEIVVPDFTGMNVTEAKAAAEKFINDNGLDLTVAVGWAHNSDPAKNGQVASQTPFAGFVIDETVSYISLMAYEGYNDPVVTTPDVTEPDIIITPDVTVPDVTVPDVTIPDITDPDVITDVIEDLSGDNTDKTTNTFASFIERIYKIGLGRDSDAEGLAFWTGLVSDGTRSGTDCVFMILDCPEFTDAKTDDTEYVKRVYDIAFGREPDTDGLNYWVDSLKNGTSRSYILACFLDSEEWKLLCKESNISSELNLALLTDNTAGTQTDPNAGAVNVVTQLYGIFSRTPDEDGLNYWTDALLSKKISCGDAVRSFVDSEEFNSLNMKADEYIKIIYATMLGRTPDEAGLQYWIEKFDNGISYLDLISFFEDAPEFRLFITNNGLS